MWDYYLSYTEGGFRGVRSTSGSRVPAPRRVIKGRGEALRQTSV